MRGYEDKHEGAFEARRISNISNQYLRHPLVKPSQDEEWLRKELYSFIYDSMTHAKANRTIGGAKYPQMCVMGDAILKIVKDLRAIHINRPLQDSILSLQERCPHMNAHKIEAHQKVLWKAKQEFLVKAPKVLHLEYDQVLAFPHKTVDQIAEFLDITPTKPQIENAAKIVRPELNHAKAKEAGAA
jgi:hypothetical protein